MNRPLRALVVLALVALAVVALRRRADPTAEAAGAPVVDLRAPWLEPRPDGSCPPGYPVKAKLSSGIFHVPGGLHYERTRADRCYRSVDAALADGLRATLR